MAGQVLAAVKHVPPAVRVSDKLSLLEEIIGFLHVAITSSSHGLKEVGKQWHAISQIKDCLETEYRHSYLTRQNTQKQFYYNYPLAMLTLNVYSGPLISTKQSTERNRLTLL